MTAAPTRAIYFRLLEPDAQLLMQRASRQNVGVQKLVKAMVLELIHSGGNQRSEDEGRLSGPDQQSEPPDPSEDILTLDEAAAYLRVDPSALATWLASGRAPGRPFGDDSWRLSREGLRRWLSTTRE
jgi:excisionase family DNA binding protein